MPAVCCNVPVLDQHPVANGIMLLTVGWPDEAHAPHAGQFFMLRCWPHNEAPTLSRPISVHLYDPAAHVVQFLYQVKGEGTRKLAALRPGNALNLTGPSGNGFDTASYTGRIAVVGGGIGTAPLYQVCRELAAKGSPADLYAGFRDEIYGMEEFAAVCRSVYLATDTGTAGFHGFVTQLLHPENYDLVLVCGPEVMMRRIAAQCAEQNVRCLVSMEKKMACGIGACLGCTCHTANGPKTVCKNGPVFEAGEVFGNE